MLHAGRRHTAHPVRKPTKRLHGRINHYVRRELVPSTQTKQDRRKYGQPVCTNCKISKRVFPWVFTRNRLTTRPFDRASVTRDFLRSWAEPKKNLGFFFSYFFFCPIETQTYLWTIFWARRSHLDVSTSHLKLYIKSWRHWNKKLKKCLMFDNSTYKRTYIKITKIPN